MAKEIGKIYRVKKQVQGIPPSTQSNDYYEPIDIGGISNSFINATNVIYNDDKEIGATNVQGAIGNTLDKLQELVNKNTILELKINNIEKKVMIPPYYIQFPSYSGYFAVSEEPVNWYKKLCGIDTTWKLKFNTESMYFRTEGSLASSGRSSSNGVQSDAGRNAVGSFHGLVHWGASGICYTSRDGDSRYYTDAGGNNNNTINIDLSRTYTTASEFRTTNRLIRVFQLLSVNGVNIADM